MPTYPKDSKIIIVGAGVFGLSNALHLAQNGYKDITVFDRLDMDATKYTLLHGADTASADVNKIFRAQYAEKKHYQDLAFEAFEIWQQWNREIALLPEKEASKYTDLRLLDMCGMLRLDDQVGWEELASRENFEKEGLGPLRYDINNQADLKRARAVGLGPKIGYALGLKPSVPKLEGAFDSTSGVLYASRACQYAKYLCATMGVKFILGGESGTFKEFVYSKPNVVAGVVTEDGQTHAADLVVISAGPWSTSLVPDLDGINEAASGNIAFFKIPEDRKDLRVKYNSKNFPIVAWKSGHSREKENCAGMFMFPIMEPEGYMKIIVRQTKYINPVQKDGKVISVPKTSNSVPSHTRLTKHIVDQLKSWISVFFPDLVGLPFETRVLWYTDTINNDYIYDFNPSKENVFVACGGSGHAFKMLPVLGRFLVDKLEGRENFYTRLFRWKNPSDYEKDPNGLREKLASQRIWANQPLANEEDYRFTKTSSKL